jgi:hypothetical protein
LIIDHDKVENFATIEKNWLTFVNRFPIKLIVIVNEFFIQSHLIHIIKLD